MIIIKKIILTEKHWLLHKNWLKFEQTCLNTIIWVSINVYTYNYMSSYIYTSDNKSVHIQLFDYFYLRIHTIIWVFILIWVKNELSKI